jgi:signal transduction histidine kinase
MMIDFFASNEEVAQLEADLPFARDAARLKRLIGLAWHTRQRDTGRSQQLMEQAQELLGRAALPEFEAGELASCKLRLSLIQAEQKWLIGDFYASQNLARGALQGFRELNDIPGCADARWLLSWIAADLGDSPGIHAELEAMASLVADIDPVRFQIARAVLARDAVFVHGSAGQEQWIACFTALQGAALEPAAQCWIEEFWGTLAVFKRDYVQAIRHFSQTYTLALASGQTRRAMIAASNIGAAFNSLNEYHAALEWMQRGLALARQSRWPGMIGLALTQTADTLRGLQRFAEAQSSLHEALAVMPVMATSRNEILALYYLGDVDLDLKQYANALESFQLLEQRALVLNQDDLVFAAIRGQAQALFQLNRAESALQAAKAVLAGEKAVVDDKISALEVMAGIHASHQLPAPPEVRAASAQLHYLQQALALAGSIPDYTVSGDLLDTVADEYADVGDYKNAYQSARQASRARKKSYLREAANRAQAVQVSHQTGRAELHGAFQRELTAEARRVEVLQQARLTLEYLGSIGQQITAHLDATQAFEVLKSHIHSLLKVDCLAIYLKNDDATQLDLAFAMLDQDTRLPGGVPLAGSISELALCAREQREILSDDASGEQWALVSRLFAPLRLAEQVYGVLTVQSYQSQAYGTQEQMIFRTLCTYTAVAIANAKAHGALQAAHRQLQETQQHLVLQGKMAGLGTLTAGIAHEINNPTNFVHVAAQNQRADLSEFQRFLSELVEADAEPEILTAFQQRFERLFGNVSTMLNGTGRIKEIVRDLRSFTRQGESEKQMLQLSGCLRSTLNLVQTSWLEQVEFITEIVDDPLIECWPALLNQVFMNLLVNGCQAISEKQGRCLQQGQSLERGKLRVRLRAENELLMVSFEDNGIGIESAILERILEPFYTTKAVGVGNGLGLSIVFGIVQKHGGKLDFTSTPGVGSCFTVSLPLAAGPTGWIDKRSASA